METTIPENAFALGAEKNKILLEDAGGYFISSGNMIYKFIKVIDHSDITTTCIYWVWPPESDFEAVLATKEPDGISCFEREITFEHGEEWVWAVDVSEQGDMETTVTPPEDTEEKEATEESLPEGPFDMGTLEEEAETPALADLISGTPLDPAITEFLQCEEEMTTEEVEKSQEELPEEEDAEEHQEGELEEEPIRGHIVEPLDEYATAPSEEAELRPIPLYELAKELDIPCRELGEIAVAQGIIDNLNIGYQNKRLDPADTELLEGIVMAEQKHEEGVYEETTVGKMSDAERLAMTEQKLEASEADLRRMRENWEKEREEREEITIPQERIEAVLGLDSNAVDVQLVIRKRINIGDIDKLRHVAKLVLDDDEVEELFEDKDD